MEPLMKFQTVLFKNMGKSQRTKGKKFERDIVEFLRVHGYDAHRTSQQDKKLDELGVDILTNAPFHIQCKHTEKLNESHHEMLNTMPDDKTPVVFHKRNNKGIIVSMRLQDFESLLIFKQHKDIEL